MDNFQNKWYEIPNTEWIIMFFAQLMVISSLGICPEIESKGNLFSEAIYKDK